MPEDEMMPPEQPTGPKGLMGRLNAMPGRPLLLIVFGALLAFLLIFAPGACSGVEVEQEQAIAKARVELDNHPDAFTPEQTEAKLLRQGFPPTPYWVVRFWVPDPEGGLEDVLQQAHVWVHAGNGEIREMQVGPSGGN